MSANLVTVINAASKGDRKAFYVLYRQFCNRVYAICWRLLADKQKAEDATQETFIKVWQQLPEFKGNSQFSTWLHTIATRTAVDVWRQDKLLRQSDNDEVLQQFAVSDSESEGLEQAIQKLPSQARAVFVLFALEGYQHQEIAGLLDIAPGTSKAQYHRARQLLKEWLRED